MARFSTDDVPDLMKMHVHTHTHTTCRLSFGRVSMAARRRNTITIQKPWGAMEASPNTEELRLTPRLSQVRKAKARRPPRADRNPIMPHCTHRCLG